MFKKIIIGLFAGIVCGFFGTGGGLILLPSFIYILKIDSKQARATSICCMLLMVLTSAIFYYKENFFDLKVGIACSIGGVIGGYLGAKFLSKLPEYILKIIFIVFLIYFSVNNILFS